MDNSTSSSDLSSKPDNVEEGQRKIVPCYPVNVHRSWTSDDDDYGDENDDSDDGNSDSGDTDDSGSATSGSSNETSYISSSSTDSDESCINSESISSEEEIGAAAERKSTPRESINEYVTKYFETKSKTESDFEHFARPVPIASSTPLTVEPEEDFADHDNCDLITPSFLSKCSKEIQEWRKKEQIAEKETAETKENETSVQSESEDEDSFPEQQAEKSQETQEECEADDKTIDFEELFNNGISYDLILRMLRDKHSSSVNNKVECVCNAGFGEMTWETEDAAYEAAESQTGTTEQNDSFSEEDFSESRSTSRDNTEVDEEEEELWDCDTDVDDIVAGLLCNVEDEDFLQMSCKCFLDEFLDSYSSKSLQQEASLIVRNAVEVSALKHSWQRIAALAIIIGLPKVDLKDFYHTSSEPSANSDFIYLILKHRKVYPDLDSSGDDDAIKLSDVEFNLLCQLIIQDTNSEVWRQSLENLLSKDKGLFKAEESNLHSEPLSSICALLRNKALEQHGFNSDEFTITFPEDELVKKMRIAVDKRHTELMRQSLTITFNCLMNKNNEQLCDKVHLNLDDAIPDPEDFFDVLLSVECAKDHKRKKKTHSDPVSRFVTFQKLSLAWLIPSTANVPGVVIDDEIIEPEEEPDKPVTEDTEAQQLFRQAFSETLNMSHRQTLLKEMKELPGFVESLDFSPYKIPDLVEYNPVIAIELLLKLFEITDDMSRYLPVLIDMDVSVHAMEVINKLANSFKLPQEFLHLYISNCIKTCEGIQDKYVQNRLVRLVCVFLQSLIRNQIIEFQYLYIEILTFCVEFSRIREAAALYRLMKQIESEDPTLQEILSEKLENHQSLFDAAKTLMKDKDSKL